MRLPPFELHPEILLALIPLWAAYMAAWGVHVRGGGSSEQRRHKTLLFSGGMFALLIASVWPIHDLADGYLYSVHMVQHMLMSFVAAPLILAGMPAWMLRTLLRPRYLWSSARFLTRPIPALIIFNLGYLFLHWPAFVDATVRSEALHFGAHFFLMFISLVVWWPVIGPLPEFTKLPPLGQMIYLFMQSILPTIPASFLTFGSTPLYTVYERFPRIWGMSALEDMRIAGLTMKLAGGAILWVVIGYIFFTWVAEEDRAEKENRRSLGGGHVPPIGARP
jgi:putative membrane protein